MKRYLIIILCSFISLISYSQEYKQFRVNEKQKKELLKNGDSFVTLIETYLNNNDKALLNAKKPSLSDPTDYINKANKNNKLYKDICFDCYLAEYNDQLKRLDNHGISDYKIDTDFIERFFNQNESQMRETFDILLNCTGKEYTFENVSFSQGRYNFKYFDETTRGTNNQKYINFITNKYNDLYSFSIVDGSFNDFSGFWIKYINPQISIDDLSKNGDKCLYKSNGKTQTIQLIKSDNRWTLRNY